MSNCNRRNHSHQGCPDQTAYLNEEILCLKHRVALLEQQVADVIERTSFIWCKLGDLSGQEILDRLVTAESAIESQGAEIDDLQDQTAILDQCGFLTVDCEVPDSGSGSASASSSTSESVNPYPNYLITGTFDPNMDGEYEFAFDLFGTINYTRVGGGFEPLQRIGGVWRIGSIRGWNADGATDFASDVTTWIEIAGDESGAPVVTLA